MANEHESNKRNNNGSRGEEGGAPQQPAPKPPATPADIAQAVSKVSATLADFTAPEQVRILTAVKFTNGLAETTPAQRSQQRPAGNNNSNPNNQRRG